MRASLLVVSLVVLLIAGCDKQTGSGPPAKAPKSHPSRTGKPVPDAGAQEEDDSIVPPPNKPGYAPLK